MNSNNLKLKDFDIFPTNEILEKVLGDSYHTYAAFIEELGKKEIEQNWQWYTPHKAWYAKGQYFWTTIRGKKKEKNLYWLFVFDGYFVVNVWFLEKNRDKLLDMQFDEEMVYNIKKAATYGKLATFPVVVKVENIKQLANVYKLIECKKVLEI